MSGPEEKAPLKQITVHSLRICFTCVGALDVDTLQEMIFPNSQLKNQTTDLLVRPLISFTVLPDDNFKNFEELISGCILLNNNFLCGLSVGINSRKCDSLQLKQKRSSSMH